MWKVLRLQGMFEGASSQPFMCKFPLRSEHLTVGTTADCLLNTCSAALLCGVFVQGAEKAESKLEKSTALALARRRRMMHAQLLQVQQGTSDAAAAIAAMLGTKSPDDLTEQAADRFKAISWDVLQHHSEIILDVSRSGAFAATLASDVELTQSVELGECDAFVSHSCRSEKQA